MKVEKMLKISMSLAQSPDEDYAPSSVQSASEASIERPHHKQSGHLNKAMDYLRQELIPKVRMWGADGGTLPSHP